MNDFTKNGKFYPYHSDLTQRFLSAGWEMAGVWIVKGLVGLTMQAFSVSANNRKQIPRVHEYVLVFRKP